MQFDTFAEYIDTTRDRLRVGGYYMPPSTWQSMDVSARPEAATIELINLFDRVKAIPGTVEELVTGMTCSLSPNLPWADDHFAERVSGQPLNPAPSWQWWPWAKSAAKFAPDGKFSHTYPERIWPRKAHSAVLMGPTDGVAFSGTYQPIGIRYRVGDLSDVVNLLIRSPDTRQAYLPIWFPEDTGVAHGERVPCTLGYHFMRRNGQLHCWYFIRSCDLLRHFADDIYLAVRLQLWLLDRLQVMSPANWAMVKPGSFNMWIGSLHVFLNDYSLMFGRPFDGPRR